MANMGAFNYYIQADGIAFLVIGIIVMIMPSPQPGLTNKVPNDHLQPFSQTRRLLAAMFIASALLLIVIGRNAVDLKLLKEIGLVRITSFVLIIFLNAVQLRSGRWKTGPLAGLITIFALLSLGYLYFIVIS